MVRASTVHQQRALHPPGSEETYERFTFVRPSRGIVWATPTEGSCLLLGRDELEVDRGAWLPVTRHAWLQVSENPATLHAAGPDIIRTPALVGQALHVLQRGVLQAVLSDARQQARTEVERLDTRDVRERSELAQSFGVLAGVVDGVLPGTSAPSRGDALLAACRLAAADAGLTLVAPAELSASRRMREPVLAIADASHVRARRVALRGAWFARDHGALVAFLESTGAPVALLFQNGKYRLVDVAADQQRVVTPAIAATLSPAAYMFLPSLGRGAIDARALWRLGASSVKPEFLGILGLSAMASGLAAVLPLVTRIIYDDVIPAADRAQVGGVAVMLVVVALMGTCLGLVQHRVLLRVEAKMEMQMEAALMDRLLRLPLNFFRKFLVGDLADRARAMTAIRAALTGTVLSALLNGVFSVVSLLLLVFFDPSLAAVGAVLAVVALAVITTSTLVSMRYQREIAARTGEVAGTLLQILSAIAKIRVAGAERRVFALWADRFAAQRSMQVRAGEVQTNFLLFQTAFPILSSMAFFTVLFAGGNAAGGGVTSGTLVASLAAFSQFTAGVLGLGATALSVLRIVPVWERVAPILAVTEEIRSQAVDPGELQGRIDVRRVGFRYDADGPLVLDDVSFHAEPGEMIALVGSSGSGKSTVARLLLGLERPESGAVFFDGQDLSGLDLGALRRQIGVVMQSSRILPGDILGNIIGPWNLTMADAWRAARQAGLADDIEAMPMGMHTMIGEGGGAFSGGQLQRMMIARALVHEPRIIVLDEATSALDNKTQRHVAECLEQLDVTRIVIAHRLSTIRNANRIYVMSEGRVVESGSYRELLAVHGPFADLAKRQLL